MLRRVYLAAAVIAMVATPAFADDACGPMPIGPAIPAASDLSGKAVEVQRAEVLEAYHQVKAYQAALKPYRGCLATQDEADKAQIAGWNPKKDAEKIAVANQRIADRLKLNDQSVDAESQVATDFNTLHTAECATDTDPKICPKK